MPSMAKSGATHPMSPARAAAPSFPPHPQQLSGAAASSASSRRGPHASHASYKGDVGQLVYCFLREYPSAEAPSAPRLRPHTLRTRTMPRQKDTKRIVVDPNRAARSSAGRAADEPHSVFKANGSPIISPRVIRHCLEEPSSAARPATNRADTLDRAAQEAQEAATREQDKALSAERTLQAGTGLSGVQLVVHQLLATHTHTLENLGLAREAFPNTRLSLKQLETLLGPVLALCNVLRPEHFGIHVPSPQVASTMSDVHYWKLWESHTIDVGIFFMPPNSTIPLHNHPGMSVVTRVLYGSAKVTSYDLVGEEDARQAEAEAQSAPVACTNAAAAGPESKVSWARVSREGEYVGESTMWLDPRRFNLHQLQASSPMGCAMLDIMVPPYDNTNRDCHHFEVLEERLLHGHDHLVKLQEAIKPEHHHEPATSTSSPTSSS